MSHVHARGPFVICATVGSPRTLDAMHPKGPSSPLRHVRLQVNCQAVQADLPSATTLAGFLLRDHLQLHGTKVACNQAACGACTVLLDGAPVFACHTLAAQCEGST